jgi:hypothetical protein
MIVRTEVELGPGSQLGIFSSSFSTIGDQLFAGPPIATMSTRAATAILYSSRAGSNACETAEEGFGSE